LYLLIKRGEIERMFIDKYVKKVYNDNAVERAAVGGPFAKATRLRFLL
jgi:hypothetical protein